MSRGCNSYRHYGPMVKHGSSILHLKYTSTCYWQFSRPQYSSAPYPWPLISQMAGALALENGKSALPPKPQAPDLPRAPEGVKENPFGPHKRTLCRAENLC